MGHARNTTTLSPLIGVKKISILWDHGDQMASIKDCHLEMFRTYVVLLLKKKQNLRHIQTLFISSLTKYKMFPASLKSPFSVHLYDKW